MPDADVQTWITCEECKRPWQGLERGWNAYRTDSGLELADQRVAAEFARLAFYCPECNEREFQRYA